MKITLHSKESRPVDAFSEREWKGMNKKHYGRSKDFLPRVSVLVARESGIIVGKAVLKSRAGVGELTELIVSKLRKKRFCFVR